MVSLTKDEMKYLAGPDGPDMDDLNLYSSIRRTVGVSYPRILLSKLKLVYRDKRKEFFEYSINFKDPLEIKYKLHVLQNIHSKEVIDRCWEMVDPRTHLLYPYNKISGDTLAKTLALLKFKEIYHEEFVLN